MKDIQKKLLQLLKTIQGNGSFATSGIKKIIPPGLHIKGVGEIGLPLTPLQIREIIKVSHKAPFGKGSKTITDTNVRRAWELNADQLSFRNDDWKAFLETLINKVKDGLGIEDKPVAASLYKLLIYEEGDFFLPHKDSEKEPGMFGTLIIGLPSTHTGGELMIRFDGKEKIVDFSSPASNYKMPYAAFFADCDHEIKPITSGYRACLVYNLTQPSGAEKLGHAQTGIQLDQMTALFKSLPIRTNKPKAVLLEHQYTPANFSWASLKHHDKPRAELLLGAAKRAGYFAELGLVTHYQMGELEGGSYDYDYRGRNSNHNSDSGNGSMGEVYEQYTTIEHWSDGETPALGKIDIGNDDLITDFEIGKEDPIEEEEEGYTGNAGMTMEYWYHYGAVIFWPMANHIDLLSVAALPVRLKWLEYYYKHWDNGELNSIKYAQQIITRFTDDELNERYWAPSDFSIVATLLLKLKDEKFILGKCAALLATVFSRIQVMNWVALLQGYEANLFMPIFEKVANTHDVYSLNHLLEILKALSSYPSSPLDDLLQHHIQNIPQYLDNVQLSKLTEKDRYEDEEKATRKATIIAILEKIIVLSQCKEYHAHWIKSTVAAITKSLPRNYVNKVLIVVSKDEKGILAKQLQHQCVIDLANRTAVKPTPPSDWARKAPNTKDDAVIWKILIPFLESPDQQVFEYRKNESLRKQMEMAINRVTVDLSVETIKKGAPYTLRITKTQAAYEKQLKHWHEDITFLKKMNEESI